MIRVLYLITSSDFGGAETLFYQQIQALDKNRYQPMVCSIKPAGSIAKKIEALGIPVKSLGLNLRRDLIKPWFVINKVIELSQIMATFKPDIVHTSLFQADVLGAIVGAWQKVPVRVATVHMVLRNKFLELLIERMLSPIMSSYLAVSDHIRHFYTRCLFLPSRKIQTVRNAVDEIELKKRASQELPASIKINFNFPWLVMVGRLDPQKDINNLLQAMKIVTDRNNKFGLVLVGEGPDRKELEQRAEILGIKEFVQFAGFQENPMPFVLKSSGMVLSSREEGLPMVILEAMALGKSIISTSVGAIPEVVEDGVSGFLVPPHDPAALAKAMERILVDTSLASQMGKNAESLLRAHFSTKVLGDKLNSVYESLINTEGKH